MCRIFSFLVLFSVSCLYAQAQAVTVSFKEAKQKGISISRLDSLYPSAASYDPSKGVFKERQKQFITAYIHMMQALGRYLKEHHFLWGERTSFFQRIYFKADGKVDYYLVNLDKTSLNEKQKTKFKHLLGTFVDTYTFPMTAESNFAQCSPVTFIDPSQKNEQK